MQVGFNRIFWGLLLVVLDLRVNSVDLFLPDFLGYILIASGLGLLVQYDRWFRRARPLAIIMIFVSLTSFYELKIDSSQAPRLKRTWMSILTGELSALLPQRIDSAELLRVTSSPDAIDANRTHNPERDKDRILGEYSDGTVVLILRYASSDEAQLAMKRKAEAEYSSDAIRKRAETDGSYKTETIWFRHGSSASQQTFSAYSDVEAADRVIQQWWDHGGRWWNPSSWRDLGTWGGKLLYIVEGHRSSAETYKSALKGKSDERQQTTIDALFPISLLGEILDTVLIWGICSGIMALSFSANNYGLMKLARRRRTIYVIFMAVSVALSITGFVAPEDIIGLITFGGFSLLIVYGLGIIISVLLIMGLVRRAARSL